MPIKLSTKVFSLIKPGKKMSKIFKAAFKDAQPKIAALIIDSVSAEANKVFKTMAPLYTEALNKPDSIKLTDDGLVVSLQTKVAQAMEKGGTALDIKKAMLAKAKRFSKDGSPYIDVPFRQTVSGSMGTTRIPNEVKRAIDARATSERESKNAPQTTRLPMKTPGKKVTRTLIMKARVGGGFRKVKRTTTHKRGLHDDLVRQRSAGKRGTVSYGTMRRISAKSAPGSWMHPGMKGTGVLKKVLAKLKPEIRSILSDSVGKVMGGKR